MDAVKTGVLQRFENHVGLKFRLYNSLFMSLPFYGIEKAGILLSLFASQCEEGYQYHESPRQIIDKFFEGRSEFYSEKERLDLLFRFIQYTERQVLLFDALEDAAFTEVNDMQGKGTLKHLQMQIATSGKEKELAEKLKNYAVLVTLTAHPTQFYPPDVLGIIWDLAGALQKNDTEQVHTYLLQLGKTPFLNREKPTPFREAKSLIWFLENVFYTACGNIMTALKNEFPQSADLTRPVLKMGFWPGGDRDGNPYVTGSTTLEVAAALRESILRCYYGDVHEMKRRLTFSGVKSLVENLEKQLYEEIYHPSEEVRLTKNAILEQLGEIKHILKERHNGLFVYLAETLITKVEIFGLHFAKLDIRQDSSIHIRLIRAMTKQGLLPGEFEHLDEAAQIKWLAENARELKPADFGDETLNDVFGSMKAIKTIQRKNGEEGCDRYIISHSTSALDVMRVYAFLLMSGWNAENLKVDIIPLIEMVDDLRNAGRILEDLYLNPTYMAHLRRRNSTQTIMLGFSDGSKDGGYFMGNWRIYKAKETLTEVSKKYGISVIFFDGRGGAAARGGGKTHNFFASMGRNIANNEIQLTVQGQTISSNFGTVESAQYNLEQLIHAGITTDVILGKHVTFTAGQEEILEQLAEDSFAAYTKMKAHPEFMNYLIDVSPLMFYNDTNIASRPTKRGKGKMNFEDLRATPFAASWSQVKQNVTGFLGVGTALRQAEKRGNLNKLQDLYRDSLFFRTLIDNCEMAMKKSFFPLTEYLSDDAQFGNFWNMLHTEYRLTLEYLQKLTGNEELMHEYPVENTSIAMRDKIILPLLTIQQYAMAHIRRMNTGETESDEELRKVYGRLVTRCSFGIINAGRNSA